MRNDSSLIFRSFTITKSNPVTASGSNDPNGDYLVVWVPATKYSLAHVHFQNSGFMVRSGASGTWWNINCFCGGPLCKAKQPWSARPFGRFSACWWHFFRYDGMSANATGMIWRTLLVALARVGNVILTSFAFGENTNILRGTVKLRCRWAVAEIKCSLLLAMISFTFLSGSNETIPTHRHVWHFMAPHCLHDAA